MERQNKVYEWSPSTNVKRSTVSTVLKCFCLNVLPQAICLCQLSVTREMLFLTLSLSLFLILSPSLSSDFVRFSSLVLNTYMQNISRFLFHSCLWLHFSKSNRKMSIEATVTIQQQLKIMLTTKECETFSMYLLLFLFSHYLFLRSAYFSMSFIKKLHR